MNRFLYVSTCIALGVVIQPAAATAVTPEKRTQPEVRLAVASTSCIKLPSSSSVRLHAKRVQLRSLVNKVSRGLCVNFTIDRKVAGSEINLAAPLEIRASNLWTVFLSILAANKLTIVDAGPMISIIPAIHGTRSPVPVFGPKEELPAEERMFTKVIALPGEKDLMALTNFLNIFKSPQGQIHPYPKKGILVITDFTSSISRLEQLIRQLQ